MDFSHEPYNWTKIGQMLHHSNVPKVRGKLPHLTYLTFIKDRLISKLKERR